MLQYFPLKETIRKVVPKRSSAHLPGKIRVFPAISITHGYDGHSLPVAQEDSRYRAFCFGSIGNVFPIRGR